MREKKKKESESFIEENIKFQYLSQSLTILATVSVNFGWVLQDMLYADLRIPLRLGVSSFYI